jgi:hypothetical protein
LLQALPVATGICTVAVLLRQYPWLCLLRMVVLHPLTMLLGVWQLLTGFLRACMPTVKTLLLVVIRHLRIQQRLVLLLLLVVLALKCLQWLLLVM